MCITLRHRLSINDYLSGIWTQCAVYNIFNSTIANTTLCIYAGGAYMVGAYLTFVISKH